MDRKPLACNQQQPRVVHLDPRWHASGHNRTLVAPHALPSLEKLEYAYRLLTMPDERLPRLVSQAYWPGRKGKLRL